MIAHRDLRNGMAHGRLRCSEVEITFSWREAIKDRVDHKSLPLSWPQMLAKLQFVEKLARDLSSQLGQIRKLVRRSDEA